jgi:predicted DNA-binding protein
MMYKQIMRTLKKRPIQIYIEPQQDYVLQALSKEKGISKAELIRESIEKYLNELPVAEDPAMELVGLGSSGKGDLSNQHDRYLTRYHSSKNK